MTGLTVNAGTADGKPVQVAVCCGNCVAVSPVRDQPNVGFCRRFPPTASAGQVNRVLAPGQIQQTGTAALWPPVRLDADYCMEFRPRPPQQ